MQGHLLDTMMVNFWYNRALPQHQNVNNHIQSLKPEDSLQVSVVTLGEIQFGHLIVSKPDIAKQAAFIEWLEGQFPDPFPIGKDTVECYGQIRSRLFRQYPPKGKKQRRPEQCFDPITATELGIDENDLWIAAQAIEHNLVLVTHDGMHRIKTVTSGLLITQDWTGPL